MRIEVVNGFSAIVEEQDEPQGAVLVESLVVGRPDIPLHLDSLDIVIFIEGTALGRLPPCSERVSIIMRKLLFYHS